MTSPFGIGAAVAAAALSWGIARASSPFTRSTLPPRNVCELAAADRSRTPATACLGCHDGGAAIAISYLRAGAGAGLSNHPVDVDYASSAVRDRRLASPSALPRGLVLVGGRVSCTTCHDGASTERNHVAVARAELCTSCHAM